MKNRVLFYLFNSQEERRKNGGSAFIEMQFCKLPPETTTEKIVSPNCIKHWQNDSLYINDETLFYQEYRHIFNCGTYSSLENGDVDLFGINYYAPCMIDAILAKLQKNNFLDSKTLIAWLTKAKQYNGLYILGL